MRENFRWVERAASRGEEATLPRRLISAPIHAVPDAHWCLSSVGGVKSNIAHALSGTGGGEKENKSTDTPREDSKKKKKKARTEESQRTKSGERQKEQGRERKQTQSFLFFPLFVFFFVGWGHDSLSLFFSFRCVLQNSRGGGDLVPSIKKYKNRTKKEKRRRKLKTQEKRGEDF